MAKAKVGDWIRITDVLSDKGAYRIGMEGVVTDATEPISAKIQGIEETQYLYEWEYQVLSLEPPKDYAEPVTQAESISDAYPKYYKDVRGIDVIDVYKTHELFGIDDPSGAIHHASKKLLLSGARTGGKSKYDDVREARDTLTRWLDMYKEKDAR